MAVETNKELYIRIAVGILMLAVFQPIIFTCQTSVSIAFWQLLFWFGFVLILTAQYSTTPAQFFTGNGIRIVDYFREKAGKQTSDPDSVNNVGFWTLMPSAFITWIFAKSILNASKLGAAWGILGSIAYAGWYTSFFSAALVIYWLRTRHNSSSLPATVQHLYGPIAQVLFCLGLLYRLNNEVWSNALVVASFYGDVKGGSWWLAAIISSIIPGCYVLLGGMRSSLVSDVVQAFLCITFLVVILIVISLRNDYDPDFEPSGGWELENGWQLLATALIQGAISYPFHDPVLTDRCYLSSPKTMLLSFLVGGFISMIYISLFGILGIYGASIITGYSLVEKEEDAIYSTTYGPMGFDTTNMVYDSTAGPEYKADYLGGEPAAIAAHLGGAVEFFVNLVFMTSSMSTLDSTFTSTAKILALDLGGWIQRFRNDGDVADAPLKLDDIGAGKVNSMHVMLGRFGIIAMVIAGILPLLEETEALNATLVSGTTVMGLGPPIYLSLFWRYGNNGWRRSPLCFIFSFITGVVYGALYQARSDVDDPEAFGESLTWGVDFGYNGSYTVLLGSNVWGHILCFVFAVVGFILDQYVLKFGEFIEMEELPQGSSNGSDKTSNGQTSTGEQQMAEVVDGATDTNTKPAPVERVMTVESAQSGDVPI